MTIKLATQNTTISKEAAEVDHREELRRAIRKKAAAEAAVEAHRGAIGRARRVVEESETRLESARTGIDAARQRDAQAAAEAIKTVGTRATATKQTESLRSARYIQQDAEDAVDVGRGALASLEAELGGLETAVALAANVVATRRNCIIAPIARGLLEHARTARRTAAVTAVLLPMLLQSDAHGPNFADVMMNLRAREQRRAPLTAIYAEVEQFFHGHGRDDDAAEARSALAALQQALARLETDPDAPLELPLLS